LDRTLKGEGASTQIVIQNRRKRERKQISYFQVFVEKKSSGKTPFRRCEIGVYLQKEVFKR